MSVTFPSYLNKGKARNLSATPVSISANPQSLFSLILVNSQGAAAFVQLFDNASPTPGTTEPDLEYEIPANTTLQFDFPKGYPFAVAVTMISTTSESGNTGSAAGVHAFLAYE